MNDLGAAHPVCESVLMSEINQSYELLIDSDLKISPNVNCLDIKVMFGDHFL